MGLIGCAVQGPDHDAYALDTEAGRRIDDASVESDVADGCWRRRRDDRWCRHEADASTTRAASTAATSTASSFARFQRGTWAGDRRDCARRRTNCDLLGELSGSSPALLGVVEHLLRARAPHITRRSHTGEWAARGAQEHEQDDECDRGCDGGKDCRTRAGTLRRCNVSGPQGGPLGRRAQRTSAGVANRAAQCGSRKTSGALFLRTYTELGQTYSARGSGRRRKVGARKREAERDTPREQARKVLDPIGLGLASNRDRAQAKESFPDPR